MTAKIIYGYWHADQFHPVLWCIGCDRPMAQGELFCCKDSERLFNTYLRPALVRTPTAQ